MPNLRSPHLAAYRAPVPLKLSALWAAVMFCYAYGDYFGLYLPGKVMAMNGGLMGPLGHVSPAMLVAVSLMMALPALMVAMPLLLPPALNRWLNLMLGLTYSAIMLLTMIGGAPPYYLVLGVIEVMLTLGIALCAWTWPWHDAADTAGGSRDVR